MRKELKYLFEAWYDNTASHDEKGELIKLLQSGQLTEKELVDLMKIKWDQRSVNDAAFFSFEQSKKMLTNILGAPLKRIINWRRGAVAAAAVVFIVFGLWFLVKSESRKDRKTESIALNDVKAPQSTKAVITLADGRVVAIDSLSSLSQGDVEVIKFADGKIVYSPKDRKTESPKVVYNTLTNPRGSKVIDMQLSDGSHVWLNAGSSITYPVAFAGNVGNVRSVKMTGEAYFEITHDETKPFIVEANGISTEVLGTHFNVNAYDDENEIKVTLLEGSVKVSNSINSKTIRPGEQAVASLHSPLATRHSPDLDEVMAWKNGLFLFKGADIETIMKQVSAWYDVDVEYADEVTEKFYADVSRSYNVSTLFKILEATKVVRFKISGNKVTVTK